VACPPGDFGKLAHAEIPIAVINSKHAKDKVHARRAFIFPRDAANISKKLVSTTPSPLISAGPSGPGSDGI
jgi:hypothetical protein